MSSGDQTSPRSKETRSRRTTPDPWLPGIDCTDASNPAIVVLDTSTGREVVRKPQDGLSGVDGCGPYPGDLIGEHLYFEGRATRQGTRADTCQGLMLDIATGEVAAKATAYLDEIRSNPRGLVDGRQWPDRRAINGIGQTLRSGRLAAGPGGL